MVTTEQIVAGLEAVPECTCHATNYYECACDAFWPEAYIPHAAAELRRLHEVNAELLEALKEVYTTCDWHGDDGQEAMMKARAAIAKATGEQT